MIESWDKMYNFSDNITKEEYDKFIKSYSKASFMQDYNWSKVKNNWESIHCGLYKDKKLIGVCLILIKKVLKNITLFYIPRGYLIDFTNFDDLKEMTNNIRKLAKKYKAYVVKIDPNLCNSEKNIKTNENYKIYSKDSNIIKENLKKLGYKCTGNNKEIGKNLQPQYNIFAPICDNNLNILSVEDILKNYKSKFKYYLGDFHEKRGITFEITDDINRTDEFVFLLKQTEKKQNITLRNKEYFIKIMEEFKGKAFYVFAILDLNKYLTFLKNNNCKEEELDEVTNLLKNKKKVILSSALIILPTNEKGIRTSEYLYAGNSENFTKLNASAGLVFEIIKFSREKGCHFCNLGGVCGDLNDHLTIFKQKFNGIVMEFIGEYDIPTSLLYYPIKLFYPIFVKIYKKIIKKAVKN